MSRYVSVDFIINECEEFDFDGEVVKSISGNTAPTIELKRGEWVLSSDGYGYIGNPVYKCSVCGWWDEQTPYNFCPNCGARMKGVDDDIR